MNHILAMPLSLFVYSQAMEYLYLYLRQSLRLSKNYKAKGRPKGSGSTWPSKSRIQKEARCKRGRDLPSDENDPPRKKQHMVVIGTAAYRSQKKRELSLANGEKKGRSGETIELDEIDIVERDEPSLITIGNERLTKSDLDILEDRGKWLNCKQVIVGVLMLRKQS